MTKPTKNVDGSTGAKGSVSGGHVGTGSTSAAPRKRRRWRRTISIEERKSRVRVWVTKAAACWVFLGSAVLVAALWIEELDADKLQAAKDIYMTVLPVATGVITYWFASRGISSKNSKPPHPEEEKEESEQ